MIATLRRRGPSYTCDFWIKNGGAALAVDSDPNSVTPSAARIMSGPRAGFWPTLMNAGGAALGPFITLLSADGTSVTLRWWWYDDTKATWIPGTTTVTLTTAGNNFQQLRYVLGAKTFVQVTANTGVTKVGIIFR